MFLMIISLNAALFLSIPIFALPFGSEVLKPVATISIAKQSPSGFNLTSPVQSILPTPYEPTCLNKKAGVNLTAVAEDCSYILNNVILRLDGVFKRREFLYRWYSTSDGTLLPSRWAFGQCIVYAGAARSSSIDRFTLFDVALTANKILMDCVKSSRQGPGGIMPIGSREETFYVDLQHITDPMSTKELGQTERSVPAFDEVSLITKGAVHSPVYLQRRRSDSSARLINLNQETGLSGSLRNLETVPFGEIDCFPPGSPLPSGYLDDCNLIINTIIVGMKDPFVEQSWGFTDDVDINLSLRENIWIFEGCAIRVQNLDEKQVDRFRPLDVAVLAQSIVQRCIVETKNSLGGNADIGHLPTVHSFYVVVTGTKKSRYNLKNSTVLSLPSDDLRTLENRASVDSLQMLATSSISSVGLQAGERYPVHCFTPGVRRFVPAVDSDCAFIINDILLRLPNLMLEQTFGYTDAEDVNLSKDEDSRWIFGQCVVFIRNINRASRDRFRYIDVVYAAHRIIEQCVKRSKYGVGGYTDIGTIEDNFYVAVAGLEGLDVRNETVPESASKNATRSSSGAIPASKSSEVYRFTESVDLDKRSSNIIRPPQATGEFAPTVRCLQPGTSSARKINLGDCSNLAEMMLRDPQVLRRQAFTTEPTGGIRMPFVQHLGSCYITMDTSSVLSTTELVPLLKIVYWALEVTLKCVADQEPGFGGISVLDPGKKIFVSVTGVDPRLVGNELGSGLDEDVSSVFLKNQSLELGDLGQA